MNRLKNLYLIIENNEMKINEFFFIILIRIGLKLNFVLFSLRDIGSWC